MVPTRKVGAGALAGAISVMLVWAVKNYGNTDLPAEMSSALTTVVTFITSYFVTDAES